VVSLTVKGLLEVGAAEGTQLGQPDGLTVLPATEGLVKDVLVFGLTDGWGRAFF